MIFIKCPPACGRYRVLLVGPLVSQAPQSSLYWLTSFLLLVSNFLWLSRTYNLFPLTPWGTRSKVSTLVVSSWNSSFTSRYLCPFSPVKLAKKLPQVQKNCFILFFNGFRLGSVSASQIKKFTKICLLLRVKIRPNPKRPPLLIGRIRKSLYLRNYLC